LAADVVAGLPQVLAATSEHFIPQMLNLDLLDALNFNKGCYHGPGDRGAYSASWPREAARDALRAATRQRPAPMSNLLLDGTKAADVLLAAELSDRVEVLAVTNLDAAGKPLRTEDGRNRRAAEPALPRQRVTGSGSAGTQSRHRCRRS
jgi:hypothetical protein